MSLLISKGFSPSKYVGKKVKYIDLSINEYSKQSLRYMKAYKQGLRLSKENGHNAGAAIAAFRNLDNMRLYYSSLKQGGKCPKWETISERFTIEEIEEALYNR